MHLTFLSIVVRGPFPGSGSEKSGKRVIVVYRKNLDDGDVFGRWTD